jgi:hypothetical protein
MTHVPTLIKFGVGVQAILRFFLRNLIACTGISDGRDL